MLQHELPRHSGARSLETVVELYVAVCSINGHLFQCPPCTCVTAVPSSVTLALERQLKFRPQCSLRFGGHLRESAKASSNCWTRFSKCLGFCGLQNRHHMHLTNGVANLVLAVLGSLNKQTPIVTLVGQYSLPSPDSIALKHCPCSICNQRFAITTGCACHMKTFCHMGRNTIH